MASKTFRGLQAGYKKNSPLQWNREKPEAHSHREASAHPFKRILRLIGRFFYTYAAFNPEYKNNILTYQSYF